MKNGKVSIIIPVYKGGKFLKEAIESALAQDYYNKEIIVINDGSPDNGETETISLSYGNKIKYITQKNGGVSSALNRGIEEASGEYISWLSHDDIYFPNKISIQVEFLKSFDISENKIIPFSDFEQIKENGEHIRFVRNTHITSKNILYKLVKNEFILNGCTLLIPKNTFNEVGLFDIRLKTIQDYDMWYRMIRAGYTFCNINQVLFKSRIHPNQDSQNKKRVMFEEEKILFKKVFSIFTRQEIQASSGLQIPCYLFSLLLFLHFKKKYVLQKSILFTQYTGIYKYISPLYRKFFT